MISISGDRPTGGLHIGHFFGSLVNRVIFQELCTQFLIIADNQVSLKDRSNLRATIIGILVDYFSVGLDFRKNNIFLQSLIPELSVLSQFLSNFLDLNKLKRIPSTKVFLKRNRNICFNSFCFPLYQSADILLFGARYVPVGLDQAVLIELTNTIVKNVNCYFGRTIFQRCIPVFGVSVPGIFGCNKMSKSLGNTIPLYCDTKTLVALLAKIKTDSSRATIFSAGNYSRSVVMSYLELFMEADAFFKLKMQYLSGLVSDSFTKKLLFIYLRRFYNYTFYRRQLLLDSGIDLFSYLVDSSNYVRRIAIANLNEIRRITGIYF
ncbi:hypothetical protein JS520_00220 [Candidatus Vidania fulgoroideae]|nr:hypothetical protein JS520_00220 [Candidatus Vidania fulgoroideae]